VLAWQAPSAAVKTSAATRAGEKRNAILAQFAAAAALSWPGAWNVRANGSRVNVWLVVWQAVCAAGLVLSVRSATRLGARSPFTLVGWLCTAAYFVLAGYDAWARTLAPLHADYALVAALTLAFIVAGLRAEPQAEPWWWPARS